MSFIPRSLSCANYLTKFVIALIKLQALRQRICPVRLTGQKIFIFLPRHFKINKKYKCLLNKICVQYDIYRKTLLERFNCRFTINNLPPGEISSDANVWCTKFPYNVAHEHTENDEANQNENLNRRFNNPLKNKIEKDQVKELSCNQFFTLNVQISRTLSPLEDKFSSQNGLKTQIIFLSRKTQLSLCDWLVTKILLLIPKCQLSMNFKIFHVTTPGVKGIFE